MKLGALAAGAAVVCLGWAASAQAGVAYNNFDAGGGFDNTQGWAVLGPNTITHVTIDSAMAFTAGASGRVTQIDLALAVSSGPREMDVSLWTDGGGAFGTELGTWHVSSVPKPLGTTPVTISGIAGVSVTAGSSYWLNASATGATSGEWDENDIGDVGVLEQSGVNFPKTNLGAFDVLTGGVPEPGVWAMMLVGLGGMGAVMRRRRPATAALV